MSTEKMIDAFLRAPASTLTGEEMDSPDIDWFLRRERYANHLKGVVNSFIPYVDDWEHIPRLLVNALQHHMELIALPVGQDLYRIMDNWRTKDMSLR